MRETTYEDGEGRRYEATGTWNIDAPNLFSFATYRMKDGSILTLPVDVAGDHITGHITGRP